MCTVEKPFYVNEAQYYKPLIPFTEEVKQEDALSSQGLDQYIITEQDKRQAGRKDRRKGRGREAESFLWFLRVENVSLIWRGKGKS